MIIQQIDIQNKTKIKVKKSFLEEIVKTSLDILRIKVNYNLGLLLVGNRFIKNLNREYRRINLSTDVLSFGVYDKKITPIDSPDKILYLGDVIISIDEAKKNSQKMGHPLESELAVLLIHGILHIFSFKHEEQRDQEKMKRVSQKILDKLVKKKVVKHYATIN